MLCHFYCSPINVFVLWLLGYIHSTISLIFCYFSSFEIKNFPVEVLVNPWFSMGLCSIIHDECGLYMNPLSKHELTDLIHGFGNKCHKPSIHVLLNKSATKHASHLFFCLLVEWVLLDHCGQIQPPVTISHSIIKV